MRLAVKTALTTGAARGIGRAFAAAYLREGAHVSIADIVQARIVQARIVQARPSDTAMELDPGNALSVLMDVTDPARIEAATGVAESYGLRDIDMLVNDAALFTAAPIIAITQENYARCLDVNVAETLSTMHAIPRHMIERGRGGKIINMANPAGRRALGRSLLRNQSRRYRPDPICRARADQPRDQRDRDLPRCCRWRALGRRGWLLCQR